MKSNIMQEKEFEKLVTEAISELPAYFREKMENVTIHIADFPDQNTLQRLGHSSPYSVLGLYQGVPVTKRGIHYGNVMPDRIFIYRKPILRKNRYNPDIKREIKRVVVHEVGHYFGLSDQELYTIEAEQLTPEKKD